MTIIWEVQKMLLNYNENIAGVELISHLYFVDE